MKRTSTLLVLTVALVLMLALAAPAATVSCSGVAAWAPNITFSAGTLVTFGGSEYRCLQSHTSQIGWEPATTPALWSLVGTCGSGGGGGGTPTPTPKPKPSPTPTPGGGGGGGGSCFATWSSTAVYTGGMHASFAGVNYQANYWTQGSNPSTNNGPAGSGQPWTSLGSCSGGGGGGGGGGTPTPTPKPTPTPGGGGGGGGSAAVAPYMDISLGVGETVASMAQQAGLKGISLAFMVDGGCTAVWGGLGGSTFPNGTSVQSAVSQLESNGVAVIISFGGANGSVLSSCGSASGAQAMYQAVVNTYHPKGLDFDIEGGVDTTVLAQALAGLKRANPNLTISLTLPVLPTGLVSAGLSIVDACTAAGFHPDLVNVMAMDYGSANDNGGQMGLDAQDAATATHGQTGLNIGITPMIGVNDTNTEVFRFSDASSVVSWAKGQGFVKRLAYWSLARDNGSCAGTGFALATCSGLSQGAFQFAHTFESF